jgi:hypothetical protein
LPHNGKEKSTLFGDLPLAALPQSGTNMQAAYELWHAEKRTDLSDIHSLVASTAGVILSRTSPESRFRKLLLLTRPPWAGRARRSHAENCGFHLSDAPLKFGCL